MILASWEWLSTITIIIGIATIPPPRPIIEAITAEKSPAKIISGIDNDSSIVFSLYNVIMKITSKSFKENELLDIKYTGYAEGISPHLKIENVPSEAKTLVIIMHDPDAPLAGGYRHFISIMPAKDIEIEEGQINSFGKSFTNDSGKKEYLPPMPPKWHTEHKYFFYVYALEIEDLEKYLSKNSSPINFASIAFVAKNNAIAEASISIRYKG